METPNIKLLKNEQYINHIDFWHSIIKIQYISNHLKPKNFKECKFGHSWINESKSPIYSTVARQELTNIIHTDWWRHFKKLTPAVHCSVQLNGYETDPYFLQLSQNITSYCLFTFVFFPCIYLFWSENCFILMFTTIFKAKQVGKTGKLQK